MQITPVDALQFLTPRPEHSMPLSRRNFLISTAAAAATGALIPARFAQAWQTQTAVPVFTPIRRNIGYFTMRGGTIGYMVNPSGVVVVDSQFPPEAKACLDGLNARSKGRGVDVLLNTHHHGDHTGGNIAFRGVAKKVVAHKQAAEHMHAPPGAEPPVDQLYPDTTFTDTWSTTVGDEKVTTKFYGRAHTSGDATITFEQANIVHMGDLLFNQRHPVVDRAAGASLHGWMSVLDGVAKDHDANTTYIFGHANTNLPVLGAASDLYLFRDYIGAVLALVDGHIKAGKSRDDMLAMREPLKGFASFGPFGAPNAREIRTCAYEEITAGK